MPVPGPHTSGAWSPQPLSQLTRANARSGISGPARTRGREDRASSPPTSRRAGLGSAASARARRPSPARAIRPPRSPQPLLPRGASPSLVPSLRAGGCSPRPGRAEGGGERGEEGERKGAARIADFRACLERALSGSPGPASQPRPAPHTSSSSSPSTPLPLLPEAASSPISATSPTLRALSWDARPRPILSSFLPSSPGARPPSPGLPPGARLSPSPLARPAPSPCPDSPSHFLSRPAPQSRRAPAAAAPLQPPQPAAPAEGAPAPAEGRSGRAPSPSPASQPCPATKDREDEQRRQSREGEHPERGQPSGGRGPDLVCQWSSSGYQTSGALSAFQTI
ncbi:RNA-binding protein with multiple splicing isoform X1 [Nycticebus coucang]|uniref:RNA-binding protein with multiple splicing isoform X1 n=1 Tax=Nycticebus coucang TaxID=9470 RepID=UPI00234CE32C|nr:RNA-binding protein with multiple splicing isoform X1 [Nycticebus coucang]